MWRANIQMSVGLCGSRRVQDHISSGAADHLCWEPSSVRYEAGQVQSSHCLLLSKNPTIIINNLVVKQQTIPQPSRDSHRKASYNSSHTSIAIISCKHPWSGLCAWHAIINVGAYSCHSSSSNLCFYWTIYCCIVFAMKNLSFDKVNLNDTHITECESLL